MTPMAIVSETQQIAVMSGKVPSVPCPIDTPLHVKARGLKWSRPQNGPEGKVCYPAGISYPDRRSWANLEMLGAVHDPITFVSPVRSSRRTAFVNALAVFAWRVGIFIKNVVSLDSNRLEDDKG